MDGDADGEERADGAAVGAIDDQGGGSRRSAHGHVLDFDGVEAALRAGAGDGVRRRVQVSDISAPGRRQGERHVGLVEIRGAGVGRGIGVEQRVAQAGGRVAGLDSESEDAGPIRHAPAQARGSGQLMANGV